MSTSNARARKGKFNKAKRGGPKKFSEDLQPRNSDGEIQNMWSADKNDEESSEESSEEEDDDSDDDSDRPGPSKADVALTREERKSETRKRKEAAKAKRSGRPQPGALPPNSSDEEEESSDEDEDDDDSDDDDSDDEPPANPNHTASARDQAAKAKSPAATEAKPLKPGSGKSQTPVSQLSRREREAIAAQQAKDRYTKLHSEGKTDEARADLARLKLVREKREAEAARKKAEAEEKAEQDQARADQMDRESRMRAAAAGPKGKGKKKK